MMTKWDRSAFAEGIGQWDGQNDSQSCDLDFVAKSLVCMGCY